MNQFTQYCVYDSPKDYPGRFVVRQLHVFRGRTHVGNLVAVVKTLAEARATIPKGLFRLPRDPKDDPVIVESWI